MNALIAIGGIVLILLSISSPARTQECTGCSRQASIEACVRCSLNSQKAKRMGYTESGIRRWCQQNQPACARKR